MVYVVSMVYEMSWCMRIYIVYVVSKVSIMYEVCVHDL